MTAAKQKKHSTKSRSRDGGNEGNGKAAFSKQRACITPISHIAAKLAEMLVMLLILSVVVFVISRLCPGDPLVSYFGDGINHMSQAQKDAARQSLGLDQPLMQQYARWAQNVLRGDWGISFKYKQPVITVIANMWVNTLILGGISIVLTFVLAIAIGKFCTLHEGSLADRMICKAGTISSCIPTFFLALMLILIFSVNLGLFPVGGAYSYGQSLNVADRLKHLILPVTVTVLEHLWYYAYMIRNKLLEETRKEYVLLCKAKGLSRRRIVRRSCMKNILPSLIVMIAISIPHILGGTYVTETVFSYPGLGTLSFESAMYQDYNMLMALCLITGAVVFFCQFIAEILNEWIDPRMRYTGRLRTQASGRSQAGSVFSAKSADPEKNGHAGSDISAKYLAGEEADR